LNFTLSFHIIISPQLPIVGTIHIATLEGFIATLGSSAGVIWVWCHRKDIQQATLRKEDSDGSFLAGFGRRVEQGAEIEGKQEE
jgi:hypothetical protein